jgi:hypothetical protein
MNVIKLTQLSKYRRRKHGYAFRVFDITSLFLDATRWIWYVTEIYCLHLQGRVPLLTRFSSCFFISMSVNLFVSLSCFLWNPFIFYLAPEILLPSLKHFCVTFCLVLHIFFYVLSLWVLYYYFHSFFFVFLPFTVSSVFKEPLALPA